MSKQGEKESVFITTKVRTKLKGDGSWLQRSSDAQAEADKEKPWLAEVRACRLNGPPVETSPVSSPTSSTPPPTKSDAERAPASGFLIRGIFTKLDKPTSSSTTNGVIPSTTQFTKKPAESYKKIAPYTVRPTSENQESQLSNEEQEKRTEAASNVLKKSSVRKRSYVFSAAKKYESQEAEPEPSLLNSSPAFLARRVEIIDDDGSAATPEPASALPPSPVVASPTEPKPRKVVNTSVKAVAVNEPVAPTVVEPAPEPVKDDPPPVSVTVNDPFEDMEPGGTKLAAPLPVRIPKCFQAVCMEPEPKDSDISGLVDLAPASPTPLPPTPAAPAPLSPAPVSAVTEIPEWTEPEIAPKPSLKPRVNTSVKTAYDVAVNELVSPKVVEPVKDDPPPVSVTVNDPFEDMEPGGTKLAAPLPVRIPKCFQAVCMEPEPKDSDISGLVDLAPASPTPLPPTPAAPAPLSPAPVSAVTEIPEWTEPEIAPKPSLKPRVNTSVKTSYDVAVNEPVSPKVVEPVKDDPPPVSVTVNDPFEDMEPGGTKLAAPLPVRIPKCFQAVCMEPEPKDSDISGLVDAPLVDLAPVSPTPAAPGQASPAPLSPAPVSAVTEIPVWTEPEIAPKPSLKPSSGVDTLATLSDTLIAFDSSSTSFWDDKPVMTEEEAGSANIQTTENGVEREAELSNCIPITDDLLALTDGPEESVDPVPPSPGRWSQDLLGGLNSESIPAKTSGTLDLLADDVIPIKTEARSLNMQREEEQTDETARETQSQEDNTDPWSSRETTTVTESSSDDPFDPYPIGTTSSNSASDLLQPHSGISSNSASFTFMENKDPSPETDIGSNALESLADNVFPINTESTSLGTERSWARTWETSPPQQANSDESQEAVPGGQTVDQETLVMFERKSSENDSPWDRWTSPIVYTLATEEEEEEEEEKESREYTETVTTITTNREIHSEQQLAMDRCRVLLYNPSNCCRQ
ncbi:zinc finger protein 185 isoform X2 [Cyclopterus lumpus]|uniref:zinc finger protein 185 isoform X2 n=1 Tax=Cyclopterus lumpus TaxID=8103 RepID=UPI00148759DA|nr:zinc finger protein 185 isoform X2 [Cyclopterus lumpus]